MSCRVITPGSRANIRRLVFCAPGQEETPEADTGSNLGGSVRDGIEGLRSEHVAELHQRILELERALQQDVRQARDSGLREGEKTGREQATLEIQPVLERLSRSLAELAGLRKKIRHETEADLVALSISIARRVLRRELSVDPEAMQGVVKAALEKVQARDMLRVRTHPDHAVFLRRHLEICGAISAADVVADPAARPGDLVIETRRGDLDASVETQLNEIERGFADRIREGG